MLQWYLSVRGRLLRRRLLAQMLRQRLLGPRRVFTGWHLRELPLPAGLRRCRLQPASVPKQLLSERCVRAAGGRAARRAGALAAHMPVFWWLHWLRLLAEGVRSRLLRPRLLLQRCAHARCPPLAPPRAPPRPPPHLMCGAPPRRSQARATASLASLARLARCSRVRTSARIAAGAWRALASANLTGAGRRARCASAQAAARGMARAARRTSASATRGGAAQRVPSVSAQAGAATAVIAETAPATARPAGMARAATSKHVPAAAESAARATMARASARSGGAALAARRLCARTRAPRTANA